MLFMSTPANLLNHTRNATCGNFKIHSQMTGTHFPKLRSQDFTTFGPISLRHLLNNSGSLITGKNMARESNRATTRHYVLRFSTWSAYPQIARHKDGSIPNKSHGLSTLCISASPIM